MTNGNGKRLILRNGTLIDGSGAAPIANDTIVIEGGYITSVGAPPAHIAQSNDPAIEIVDATGQYIMPGMIDGHCHLSLHQGALRGVRYPASAEFCTIWAMRAAARTLHAGVTSISCPGGKWFVDVTVRDAVRGGLIEGPRIFCGGRALTPYGGIFDGEPAWQKPAPQSAGALCNTVDEYVTEVRRQCKHGVDLIKVADSDLGEAQTVAPEELSSVVTEAHRRNVRVCVHARGAGAVRTAAQASVDWIFHADLATDEDLDAVAAAGIPIIPTFAANFVAIEHGAEFGVGQALRDTLKWQMEVAVNTMIEARKRGIPILIGTDSGNAFAFQHGRFHAYEAEIFVKHLGFSPMDAILASTRDNAVTVGLEGKLGIIGPGKIADIILLDADPLGDITRLRPEHLTAVIKDGQIVPAEERGFLPLPQEPRRAGGPLASW
jgi:imidazolonepropionase-like amidohydrolase